MHCEHSMDNLCQPPASVSFCSRCCFLPESVKRELSGGDRGCPPTGCWGKKRVLSLQGISPRVHPLSPPPADTWRRQAHQHTPAECDSTQNLKRYKYFFPGTKYFRYRYMCPLPADTWLRQAHQHTPAISSPLKAT